MTSPQLVRTTTGFSWHRIRTLLWKEWSIFKTHFALQLILALLVVFGVSISFSRQRGEADYLSVVFAPGGDQGFKNYLMLTESDVRFFQLAEGDAVPPVPNRVSVAIPEAIGPGAVIKGEYRSHEMLSGMAVRQVLRRRLFEYLDVELPVSIELSDDRGRPLTTDIPSPPQRSPFAGKGVEQITMLLLCTMAIVMISFNMFTILASEEKSSKTLLAQLISPATVEEILCAKMCFYVGICYLVLACLVGPYRPQVLVRPAFWFVLTFGALAYMSVASLAVVFSSRQSSANVFAFGYVLVVSLIMFLARDFEIFHIIQNLLPEMYIFTILSDLFQEQSMSGRAGELRAFFLLSAAITALAYSVARRRGARGT